MHLVHFYDPLYHIGIHTLIKEVLINGLSYVNHKGWHSMVMATKVVESNQSLFACKIDFIIYLEKFQDYW